MANGKTSNFMKFHESSTLESVISTVRYLSCMMSSIGPLAPFFRVCGDEPGIDWTGSDRNVAYVTITPKVSWPPFKYSSILILPFISSTSPSSPSACCHDSCSFFSRQSDITLLILLILTSYSHSLSGNQLSLTTPTTRKSGHLVGACERRNSQNLTPRQDQAVN